MMMESDFIMNLHGQDVRPRGQLEAVYARPDDKCGGLPC